MDGLVTDIERWHDFYVAAGGAAAVLLGLLFLSVSLHLDREASQYDILYRMSVQTMIDFAYALAAALLMLVPITNPLVLGGRLLILGFAGLQDTLRVVGWRGQRGWPHLASLACFAALIGASIALLFAVRFGLYVAGLAIGVLIIAGTRNTWEILIRARGGFRCCPRMLPRRPYENT
jgi:hypothetical protein